MAVSNYAELSAHLGHEVEVADYGNGQNIAVECIDCSEVILDYELEATNE